MSSLPQAIKFRALADKLNDTEFNTFILKLIEKCGRNMLLTPLFNHFIENSNQQTLKSTITIIKSIINSRKPEIMTKNTLDRELDSNDDENMNDTSNNTEIWYKGTEILNRRWSIYDEIEYDSDPDHKQNDNKSHIDKGPILCVYEDYGEIVIECNDGTSRICKLEKVCIKFNSSNIHLSHNTTIHSLPTELIGEIASYLFLGQYQPLNTSNRSIYIACNTPNTLRYLYLSKNMDYSSIKLQKFPKLENLCINLSTFNQLKLPLNGSIICNHLKALTLNGNDETDLNIDHFIKQNAININNITHLNLESFGKIDNDGFIVNKFCRLLTQFPMIQYLTISDVYLTDPNLLNLQQLLPNLQGVACNGGDVSVSNDIIRLFGNNLKAMSFIDGGNSHIPSIVTFSNLEELGVIDPTMSTLNDILKSAKNLKKIYLSATLESMTNTQFKNIMKRLISEHKSLQYLGIRQYEQISLSNFGDICDGIECGLYNAADKHNNIKIMMEFGDESTKNIETTEILIRIQRIILQLKTSNIPNFMFSCRFYGEINPNKDDWIQQSNHFKKKNKSQIAVYRSQSIVSVVVTNKKSKINGWLESWLLTPCI